MADVTTSVPQGGSRQKFNSTPLMQFKVARDTVDLFNTATLVNAFRNSEFLKCPKYWFDFLW